METIDYYKLINGAIFVGVTTRSDFRLFQHKHQIILGCDVEDAQYIQHGELYYRADWMVPVTTDKIPYETVDVVKIDKDEYDILLDAIEVGEQIEIEESTNIPATDEPVTDNSEVVTVEYLKTAKIAEMRNACNKSIEEGIDVILSDGETRHYSLTTQDQLNLITLSSMIAAGESEVSYHADGELCRYYAAEDIVTIINAAIAHKAYHIAYFNSLKGYIGTMETIEEVYPVKYGMAIPVSFQSEPLKAIIKSIPDND